MTTTRGGQPLQPRWVLGAALVATCTMVALSWWTRARCLTDLGWSGGEQYLEYCYSDVVALWHTRGLDEGGGPFPATPLEYPTLLTLRAWAAAEITHALPGSASVKQYLGVNAVWSALEAALTTVLLWKVAGRRALWFAAAPALGLYALLNWDTLPVLLSVLAVVLHLWGKHTSSGAVAGLGAAAKLYPGFLVPVIALGLVRQRRYRAAALHTLAAAGAWLVVNVPAYLASKEGWSRFYELSRERSIHPDTLWWLGGEVLGHLGPEQATRVIGATFLLGGSALVLLGTRRTPPERTWQLGVLVLVWFALTNKVYSPQYTLWLVPLLALTLQRKGAYLTLLAADVVVYAVEFRYLAGTQQYEGGLPYEALAVAVVVRALALAWVAYEVLAGRTLPLPGTEQEEAPEGADAVRAETTS